MSVFDILMELAATSSRNDKIAILEREKNNQVLKEVCRLALDPLTQFYIRKIPIVDKHKQTANLAWGIDALARLSNRSVTGNAAIEYLKSILEALGPEDALVIERIIAKDLRCGVSTATVNKVWPGLVHEFSCMLASGFEEKSVAKIQWPAIAQLKLDGMRSTAVVKNGGVTLYSRNGKEIDVCGVLDEELKELASTMNLAIDGELVVVNDNGVEDRQTGNGILNKAIKGTISQEECEKILFILFDMIPLEDFENGYCDTKYSARFDLLKEHFSLMHAKRLRIVESNYVQNMQQVYKYFEEVSARGEEGIILKDLNKPWEGKRVKHQVKFKAELDTDLVCIDWVSGQGKYKNSLGALLLQSSCGKLEVSVGTGLSDTQRNTLTPEDCIGKIVAVRYNAKIKDKKSGKYSLFLPRFLEIREDKDEADSLESIKG